MQPKQAQAHWQARLNTQRFKEKNGIILPTSTLATTEGMEVLRTDFHIDYDRVVFSRAFRRLGRKTQVHPFAKSDHTHNRLTHSVEVASVGRSLGNHVGACLANQGYLPDRFSPSNIGTVVQVACLAHDLGNPPFGHTGEAALREWFCDDKHAVYLEGLSEAERYDICTYEGNAHSLRIVSRLEMYHNAGGMRLTAASVGTMIKYPWQSHHPLGISKQKFNIYQSEMSLFNSVAEALDLPIIDGHGADSHYARHPLSYLMEMADDICYALLDLEDAVEIGLINVKEFTDIIAPIIDTEKVKYIENDLQRCGAMRGMAIGRATEAMAAAFMQHHDEILTGRFIHKDLLAVCDSSVQQVLNNAKKLAAQQVFTHYTKLSTEIAAFGCLGSILELLIPAVYAHHQHGKDGLSTKQKLALKLLPFELSASSSLYQDYMSVLDFICALTDNTAGTLANELSGISMV